ncbi:peptidylprolyl isomerase [Thiohalorhabdus sp.]|uniref:peptidylprolyl isomerase n=1 Tax=Thiohalorhabdus sp. TaxID=3094134 RepID=UPI002FC35DFF
MLDFMRSQAQGWIVKVLFAVIVLSFALWGVGDYFTGQSTVVVAEVGDQSITQAALQNRVRQERNRLRRLLGPDFNADPKELEARVLKQMVRDRMLDLEARRLQLTASDAAVRRAIQTQPQFRQGGSFNTERYRNLIDRMGMAPSDFEARTRQDLAVQDLRNFLRQATVVADEEVWRAYRRENERRTVRYFRLAPQAFAQRVTLSEADLRAYYEDNQQDYRRPAQVRVRYLLLSPENLADQFNPEPGELEAYLRDHGDRYAAENGEVPPLAEVRDQVLGDWRRQQATDRIYERLPTFEDLLYTRDDLTAAAQEFGLEVRTSGWIPERGELPDGVPDAEAFRKAALGLQPDRNSEAVELGDGRFAGLHLAESRAPTVRDFSGVKEAVQRDLRRQRASELAREGAEQAREALARGAAVSEVAGDYGAEVDKAVGVTRAQAGQKLPEGLATPVFGASEGDTGSVRLSQGDQAVFRVAEVTAPPREAMEPSQRDKLASQLREKRGEARMEAFFERLRKRYSVRIRREVGGGSA